MSIADIKMQAVYGGEVTRALEKWRLGHEKAHRRMPDGFWHPSSLSGCPTASVYEQLGFPLAGPPHDARLLRIFDLGTAIHTMLQAQFIKAGIVAMVEQPAPGGKLVVVPAVEIPVEDVKYRLRGTLDVVFNLKKRCVGELKSKHSGAFAKMTVADPRHVIQATCYHWKAADNGWVDDECANILYYSKDDSRIREFREPITGAHIQAVKDKLDVMNNMEAEFLATSKVPEPFYKESHKPPCRTCPWAPVCHASITREAWVNKIKESTNAKASAAPQSTAQPTACRRTVPTRK